MQDIDLLKNLGLQDGEVDGDSFFQGEQSCIESFYNENPKVQSASGDYHEQSKAI
jgi:hypothetical protein